MTAPAWLATDPYPGGPHWPDCERKHPACAWKAGVAYGRTHTIPTPPPALERTPVDDFAATADYDLAAGHVDLTADPDQPSPKERFLRLLGEAVAMDIAHDVKGVPVEVSGRDGRFLGGNQGWAEHYPSNGQSWTVQLRASAHCIRVYALGGPTGGSRLLNGSATELPYPGGDPNEVISTAYRETVEQAITSAAAAISRARYDEQR
ncbi:hypothetical protein [Nonomuraea sp. NPDC003214]